MFNDLDLRDGRGRRGELLNSIYITFIMRSSKGRKPEMSDVKRSIGYTDDGQLMAIEGDIAHADYGAKQLLKQGRITKAEYKSIQIHLHYLREAKAEVDPPRPYWVMSNFKNHPLNPD